MYVLYVFVSWYNLYTFSCLKLSLSTYVYIITSSNISRTDSPSRCNFAKCRFASTCAAVAFLLSFCLKKSDISL